MQDPCHTDTKHTLRNNLRLTFGLLVFAQIILSPIVTIDPRKWPKVVIGGVIIVLRTMFWLPFTIRDEVSVLLELKNTGHVSKPNTLTWKYAGTFN